MRVETEARWQQGHACTVKSLICSVHEWLCSTDLSLDTENPSSIIFHTRNAKLTNIKKKNNNTGIHRIRHKCVGVPFHDNLK